MLFICEDVSSISSCMTSVSNISFSMSSGSSSRAAIFSSKPLSISFFRASCSRMLLKDTRSIYVCVSLAMSVVALLKVCVR